MPSWFRVVHSLVCLSALAALGAVGAPGQLGQAPHDEAATVASPAFTASVTGLGGPSGQRAPSTLSPAPPGDNGQVREVSFQGVVLHVPASWPVVDLRATPGACVRLDRQAVYLGDPGTQQDCPAHLVGRADTIWLHRATAFRGPRRAARAAHVGAIPAEVVSDPVEHGQQVHFTHQDVQLDASWGPDSHAVDRVLASAGATSAGPTVVQPSTFAQESTSTSTSTSAPAPATARPAAATSSSPSRDLSSVQLTDATTTASSTFTGMAFDTCAAPSLSTMSSWLSSPYRSLGIYIGGSMRACGDGNLSSSWVSSVKSMGWGLAPIYVGPQAPCVNQSGLTTITPSQAGAQGKSTADDAVSRAASFGLGAGTPIYYDMEAYNTTVSGCSSTVMTFLSAWSSELTALGYSAGAYGSTDSLMTDLSKAMGTAGFVPPTTIWFADWNGLQTTSDSYFSSAYWTNHQRLHQYSGGINQTWGGVTVNIDANWFDGPVAGVALPVDYGAGVVGPGSTGFVFTGSMSYWRPNATHGVKGMAYWTYSSGGGEYNGATWAPRLAPGLYSVQAYIPDTNATAAAPYTVTDANGSTVNVVNQQPLSGYTSLGTYKATSTTSISVHVGDNDGTTKTTQLGIDAMAFQLVGSVPGAPFGVAASGANASATVTWGAAAPNGSPVQSYTVTASPGGATVTAPGTATSTTFSGLTNGTAYSFTVTATNGAGSGPSSTSNTVTPQAPVTAPAPATQAHDWNSDNHNDVLARDGSGTLWLYPGNGTGGWLSRQQVRTSWNGMTALLAPGDFNGDGHPDVLARDSSGNLWLYGGNGSGGWLTIQRVGTGWNGLTLVAPGDFDGDGHPDVLARDGSGNLWLYPGNGTGGWLARQQVGTSWNGMTALLAPGDFNGDGHPDLLARDGSGNLWLYPGNGTGGWLTTQRVGTGWNGMTALVGPGDFNGDGHPDVLARDSAGTLRLYPGNGTGGWLTPQQVGTGWNSMTALT